MSPTRGSGYSSPWVGFKKTTSGQFYVIRGAKGKTPKTDLGSSVGAKYAYDVYIGILNDRYRIATGETAEKMIADRMSDESSDPQKNPLSRTRKKFPALLQNLHRCMILEH